MTPPRLRVAALRYDHPADRAPKLVARGDGHVAEKIIALAREHGVPIHEDRELVATLARLDLDEDIPVEVYQVVAEILAFLYRARFAAGPPRRGRELLP
jgi:flagellar biosynthesis protein